MGWKLIIGVLLVGMTSFGEELKTIDKGPFSGLEKPLQAVVTNKTQWTELWDKHNSNKLPKPALPEIDFQKNSVIFVTLGRKNTGGYTIEISDVHRSKDKTEITVISKGPRKGAITLEALTAPFHIVEVPKIEGEIKFKTTEDKKGA